MFGTYGDAGANDFVIGSETANTNFSFKSGLGIQPINLEGGTTLMTLQSDGQILAPLLTQSTMTQVLTFNSNNGRINN